MKEETEIINAAKDYILKPAPLDDGRYNQLERLKNAVHSLSGREAIETFESGFDTKDFKPFVNGKRFQCRCGCEVFRRHTQEPLVYRCTACGEVYVRKTSTVQSVPAGELRIGDFLEGLPITMLRGRRRKHPRTRRMTDAVIVYRKGAKMGQLHYADALVEIVRP